MAHRGCTCTAHAAQASKAGQNKCKLAERNLERLQPTSQKSTLSSSEEPKGCCTHVGYLCFNLLLVSLTTSIEA